MSGKTKKRLRGARILIETLIEQGVTEVFGYPGGAVLDIYDELYRARRRLHHVLTAHEQGAAHAADGYARTTGKVGVVLATSGPGATNLVTGIATAMLDSVPLVAITGNVATTMIGRDSFQEINITGITLPITKHNYFVQDVRELADTVREAFRVAKEGRPGPVLIDIPKDVQQALCAFESLPVAAPRAHAKVDDAALDRAAKLLCAAERPYLYIGGGALGSGVGDEIQQLAQTLDAVIGCSLMGLTAVPTDAPRFLGMQGMHGRYASTMASRQADLIFGVGVRFSDRATLDANAFSNGVKLLQLDIDVSEINKNVIVDLGLVGDLKDALTRLLPRCKAQRHPDWLRCVAALREQETARLRLVQEQSGTDLTPQNIFAVINDIKTPKTVLATDVGQHQMWAAQFAAFTQPHRFVTSGGLGAMGYGLGAAVGACIGTKTRTVLITGDGSFGMNLTELATAVSQQLELVIVLLNNRSLGMVRQWQHVAYGKRYAATDLSARKTDFIKVAEAFGMAAQRTKTLAEFRAAFESAMQSAAPVLLEVAVDPEATVASMFPQNE